MRGHMAAAPSFVEVMRGPSNSVVEVVFASGTVLRVPFGFDDETVRRLVDLLEGRSRC